MSVAFKHALPSDELKWVTIYPAYLNSKRTKAQGRRIPAAKAVDNPTSTEIFEILRNAHFNVRIEKKYYPRDHNRDPQYQGRVRVQLLDSDGRPVNAAYGRAVMLYVCSMIPKLKTRQGRGGAGPSTLAASSNCTDLGAGPKPTHKKKR